MERKINYSFLGDWWFLPVIAVVISYAIFCLSADLLLTEIFYLVPVLPSVFITGLILITTTIYSLIDWNRMVLRKIFWFFLVVFFLVATLLLIFFPKIKQQRANLPKIYKVDPSWGIQGQLVKISGFNFGPTFAKGKVWVGSQEMNVLSWEEKLIVVEQSVVSDFGVKKIKIKTAGGEVSNEKKYEFRNPDSLKTKEPNDN